MKLVVSERARTDLNRIRAYTLDRWGEKQLVKYTLLLEKALFSIERNPEMGKQRKDTPEGVKSLKTGRHVLFYRLESGRIVVDCVLHERMDFLRHLG